MSDALFQAGQYQLVSVYLRNYIRSSNIEISNLIVGFTINESMSSPFVYGKTTVFDGDDILSTLPVIGEEFIEFTYTDIFGQTRVDEFMVYSVSDVKYPDESNPTMIQYTLNFVSIPRVLTDGFRIMKGFSGQTIKDYAENIFKNNIASVLTNKKLKAKDLISETTDVVKTVVIPNYNPTDAMLFLARHAYRSDASSVNQKPTQTFRFFENRDSYFFATNEYVKNHYGNINADNSTQYYLNQKSNLTLPDAHVFSYNYLPNMSPEAQQMQMFNIISIDFGEKVNTINDIKYGAYKKRLGQIDILTGTAQILPTYEFSNEYSDMNLKLPHSPEFINDAMSDKYLRYVIKDYSIPGEPQGPGLKADTNYSDLYTRKSTYLYHYKQNSIDVTIYGRNNIVAGSVIYLNLPLRKRLSNDQRMDSSAIDIERSGYYLVDEVKNIFANKSYIQKMTLSRYGIGTK